MTGHVKVTYDCNMGEVKEACDYFLIPFSTKTIISENLSEYFHLKMCMFMKFNVISRPIACLKSCNANRGWLPPSSIPGYFHGFFP